ncbi:hypothetical protein [Streptomyces noursei]|uniref:hypothetical protein n=1 Tax=Streptomyces noursei TaxID=1971 RepID=UPI0016727AB2|nr:hypothetical protein [Streptomyces noursei]MCZ1013725.1 hypothetical protein [Streptomyces noursei]GGX24651.1 hypothetical protein GCM10010341_52170 [Streptomyces noursei]
MRERDRAAASASAVAWAGVAAFLVCLLVRKVAPFPRWDLLVCLAVSGGAAMAWWRVAQRPAGASPERRGELARWWPGRRDGMVSLALMILATPLLLLMISVAATTPELAAIVRGGPVLSRVTVQEIHSTSRNQSRNFTEYTSSVSVALPDGRRGTHLTTESVTTSHPLKKGDRVWALHSSSGAVPGAVLDPSWDELHSLLGGHVSRYEAALLTLWGCFTAGFAALVLREGTTLRHLNAELAAGRSHMLRVHIADHGAGFHFPYPGRTGKPTRRRQLAPALRLISPDGGGRVLFLDRCLDPVPLAKALHGLQGWLYWTPRPDAQLGWTEPALLVLDDGRYLLGATPDGPPPDVNAGAPPGEPVTQPLPSPKPARAVGPYVLWQPHIHKPGVIAFGIAFLSVCLIAAGIGYGNTAALGICLAAAALGPVVGLLLIGRQRTRYLRSL